VRRKVIATGTGKLLMEKCLGGKLAFLSGTSRWFNLKNVPLVRFDALTLSKVQANRDVDLRPRRAIKRCTQGHFSS